LDKVAALIEADFPTKLYYVPLRNSLFDTHVNQAAPHDRQLEYCADAIAGFFQEMKRIGRADDVVMYVHSEFGRRVPENTSLGTDHGTAQVNFIVGNKVKGGMYGAPPSLTNLVLDGNLENTTDFRESRPEATDRALKTGASMGIDVKPAGNRAVQPVSDRFFYWLRATMLETRRLGYWWANRMLQTTHPVEQKMSLFWHGHFAT